MIGKHICVINRYYSFNFLFHIDNHYQCDSYVGYIHIIETKISGIPFPLIFSLYEVSYIIILNSKLTHVNYGIKMERNQTEYNRSSSEKLKAHNVHFCE